MKRQNLSSVLFHIDGLAIGKKPWYNEENEEKEDSIMAKRILSLLVAAVMVLGLLAACGNDGPLTAEEAKKVVLKDLDITESQLTSIDMHPIAHEGAACYAFYVTVNGKNWEFYVDSQSGQILHKAETDHAHSH